MSQLPDVTETIRDGALGVVPANTQNVVVKAGACVLGKLNTLIGVADLAPLQTACGKRGQTVEAAAVSLNNAGGPLYVLPVNPSTYGTPSAVVKVGAGAETLTALAKPPVAFILKCCTLGATATAQFQLSVDGGVTYGAPFVTAATVMLPSYSFVTMAFGSGAAVVGDTYSVSTDGTVTAGGSNTGTLAVTISAVSTVDAFSFIVSIVTAGALGTAQFTYSLDGGLTTSGTLLVPSSGKYVVPDTGVLLTFSGTSTAGDYFTFTTTAPTFTTTDLTNAVNAILALPQTWFLFHVVGQAASASAAATLLATLDSLLTTAQTNYRFARGLVECPWDSASQTDSVVSAAFAAAASLRVGVGVGPYVQVSPLNGSQLTRNAAWQVSARLAKNKPSQDAAKYVDGPLSGVISLVRDEGVTPGLDIARFCTLRTFVGPDVQGVYITNARLMAPTGSDYSYFVNGRVMDIFCASFRLAALKYLNAELQVDANTGFILETDASAIDKYIGGQTRAVLTQPGFASSLTIKTNRNNNILSTGQLQITGRVIPLGYARAIAADLGFTNPALAQN